mgnify:CR=1 FL=1
MNPMMAAKAYQAIQGGALPTGAATPTAAPGFGEILSGVMDQTQMTAQIQGRGELIDVVTAVASAEASLETVMAVRDQVISAYQEIMRMPI